MRDANYANDRELLTGWTGGRKVNHGWGGAMDNGQGQGDGWENSRQTHKRMDGRDEVGYGCGI